MGAIASYSLERFTSSKDPRFQAALLLYVRNTDAVVRTNTNEIAFWLEKFEPTYGDTFYVFGFYRNGDLVGYAEGAYFRDEEMVALDYLVIDAAHRKNNVYFEFVDHLREFFADQHPEFRYAVAEAPYGPGYAHPSRECSLTTRLLKLSGFRVIRAPYYHPRLSW